MSMKISEYLKIEPGVTALIGGGGKTTLMYKLSEELSLHGSVIVCTSTKVFEPEGLPVLTGKSKDEVLNALRSRRVICAGTRIGNGKLSAPAIGFDELKKAADYIIVEADGAHRLPAKAHADHEPVIPECTDKTVLVLGADAFGRPIAEICHRPELFASIAGVDILSPVTPETVCRVITRERLGDCLYINKVEDGQAAAKARELAEMLEMPVTAGSLNREEYICLR